MVRCLTEDGTRLSAGWLGLIFRWSWEMLFLKLYSGQIRVNHSKVYLNWIMGPLYHSPRNMAKITFSDLTFELDFLF